MTQPAESKTYPNMLESLAAWAMAFEYFAFYVTDKNNFSCAVGASRNLVLIETQGAFEKLEIFQTSSHSRIAGYLGYDLKNDLENLHSKNPDDLEMPAAVFFEPEIWIFCENGNLRFVGDSGELIASAQNAAHHHPPRRNLKPRIQRELVAKTSREKYLENVHSLQNHLRLGNIYEANYCIQFTGTTTDFQPLESFLKLREITEAPFSVFSRLDQFYVLCASPERFLKNSGGRLLSQPIKGTIRRSKDPIVDLSLQNQLRDDPKEQSENVMIVDLVRNDLSRVAARGSVKVDELFGMYAFKTVHHMISSISAELDSEKTSWDAIKVCFPMGSMTGAPKIRAMELIESHENFKRGAYSGGFGWMDPNGDFDFNVMIRALFYNAASQQIGFSVGSAITVQASAEKEYEECLLKAEALMQALHTKTSADEVVRLF